MGWREGLLLLPASLTETVATTVTAAVVAAAEAATIATLWAVFAWASQADIDGAAIKFFAVELVDSLLVVIIVDKCHESESTASASLAVGRYLGALDFTDLLEKCFQAVIVSRVSEAADKKILLLHVLLFIVLLIPASDRPASIQRTLYLLASERFYLSTLLREKLA